MSHKLELRHLGPIDDCSLIMDRFTVFTGPQSNGKSTVAKAVYFFRTVKQDILSIMMQGGPAAIAGSKSAKWEYTLKQRMRLKFLELFGTSWIMPDDMCMRYTYKRDIWIRTYLKNSYEGETNFVEFEFAPRLHDYLNSLNSHVFTNMTPGQKDSEEKALVELFEDPYETIFIPAGRTLITLLSTQLNYIFTSLENTQLRSIDYTTKRYTELILKLKPLFSQGMSGLLFDVNQEPERTKRYKKHRNAIELLQEATNKIIGGTYRCVDGEERLYLDEQRYIKINFTSSGQQEIVWVLNLLFYYLLEDRKVFLILEEPESHLFPASQQIIGQILGLFSFEGNAELITTHSPYLLGTFNYMLLAGQTSIDKKNTVSKHLDEHYWLNPKQTAAYYVHDHIMTSAFQNEAGLALIQNELIDGASQEINEMSDFMLAHLGSSED